MLHAHTNTRNIIHKGYKLSNGSNISPNALQHLKGWLKHVIGCAIGGYGLGSCSRVQLYVGRRLVMVKIWNDSNREEREII